jgi:hypothetical protein
VSAFDLTSNFHASPGKTNISYIAYESGSERVRRVARDELTFAISGTLRGEDQTATEVPDGGAQQRSDCRRIEQQFIRHPNPHCTIRAARQAISKRFGGRCRSGADTTHDLNVTALAGPQRFLQGEVICLIAYPSSTMRCYAFRVRSKSDRAFNVRCLLYTNE